jgi:hypothetical protein
MLTVIKLDVVIFKIIVILSVIKLDVVKLSVAFIYCRFAECRYAVCHGSRGYKNKNKLSIWRKKCLKALTIARYFWNAMCLCFSRVEVMWLADLIRSFLRHFIRILKKPQFVGAFLKIIEHFKNKICFFVYFGIFENVQVLNFPGPEYATW